MDLIQLLCNQGKHVELQIATFSIVRTGSVESDREKSRLREQETLSESAAGDQ